MGKKWDDGGCGGMGKVKRVAIVQQKRTVFYRPFFVVRVLF